VAVTSLSVVEHFDVAEDIGSSEFSCFVEAHLDPPIYGLQEMTKRQCLPTFGHVLEQTGMIDESDGQKDDHSCDDDMPDGKRQRLLPPRFSRWEFFLQASLIVLSATQEECVRGIETTKT